MRVSGRCVIPVGSVKVVKQRKATATVVRIFKDTPLPEWLMF